MVQTPRSINVRVDIENMPEIKAQFEAVAAERDALATTVQRVRALCDEVERVGRKPDWSVSTMRLRAALAPSDPATDTGGEGQ